ncbi:MAG: hypothetical protein AB8C84_11490 [Oligoflexales bacterium]
MEDQKWKKCGPCGKEIHFNSTYIACGTPSCQKSAFCSLDCWNAHVPVMNHKDAWAEERTAPSSDHESSATAQTVKGPQETLVVASKLKHYIKETSGLNTSASVLPRLSDIIRRHCDKAAKNAKTEGRKTVLSWYFEDLLRNKC